MPAIDISTIGDLIGQRMTMSAWCPSCKTARPVDLERLAEKYGREASYIRPGSPVRIRCAACGARDLPVTIATR